MFLNLRGQNFVSERSESIWFFFFTHYIYSLLTTLQYNTTPTPWLWPGPGPRQADVAALRAPRPGAGEVTSQQFCFVSKFLIIFSQFNLIFSTPDRAARPAGEETPPPRARTVPAKSPAPHQVLSRVSVSSFVVEWQNKCSFWLVFELLSRSM